MLMFLMLVFSIVLLIFAIRGKTFFDLPLYALLVTMITVKQHPYKKAVYGL